MELAYSRYNLGEAALLTIARQHPRLFVVTQWRRGDFVRLVALPSRRIIEFRRGNMFDVAD
ncbi:MAG: hypothetical protein ACK4ZJ_17325, partial [Allorhizobium sp.]